MSRAMSQSAIFRLRLGLILGLRLAFVLGFVGNYRLISLLSIFNRLIEKLMYNRLITYIDKINVLCDNQFGCRKNHATTHAL